MPTILRLAIATLSTVLLTGGALVLALGSAAGHQVDPGPTVGGALALVALVFPQTFAGLFVSYWSWDGGARRPLRIAMIVLVAVQLAGIAGLVAVVAAAPSLVVGAVGIIAAALVLDPVALLLGRAARRRELAAPKPALDDADAAILAAIRRGWRRTGLGAAIGLVTGLAVLLALGLTLDDGSSPLALLVLAPAGIGLGASIGGLTSTLPLASRVRDLLGGGYSGARRIGLAIRGKDVDLSEEEADRAARYAAIAPAWQNLQLTAQSGNILTSFTVIGALGLEHADLRWVMLGYGAVAVVCIVLVIVLRRVQLRRFRVYSAAHPVAA